MNNALLICSPQVNLAAIEAQKAVQASICTVTEHEVLKPKTKGKKLTQETDDRPRRQSPRPSRDQGIANFG